MAEEKRGDLERLLERRLLTADAARPQAGEKRHAGGGQTARENLDDLVDPLLTVAAEANAEALNAATLFELDDVIDPAETRGLIARTLAAAGPTEPSGRFVDTW